MTDRSEIRALIRKELHAQTEEYLGNFVRKRHNLDATQSTLSIVPNDLFEPCPDVMNNTELRATSKHGIIKIVSGDALHGNTIEKLLRDKQCQKVTLELINHGEDVPLVIYCDPAAINETDFVDIVTCLTKEIQGIVNRLPKRHPLHDKHTKPIDRVCFFGYPVTDFFTGTTSKDHVRNDVNRFSRRFMLQPHTSPLETPSIPDIDALKEEHDALEASLPEAEDVGQVALPDGPESTLDEETLNGIRDDLREMGTAVNVTELKGGGMVAEFEREQLASFQTFIGRLFLERKRTVTFDEFVRYKSSLLSAGVTAELNIEEGWDDYTVTLNLDTLTQVK